MREVVARLLGGVLQKSFPKIFTKIHREIPVLESLSNTVKCFQAVRFATCNYYPGRDPGTGASEPAVCRSSTI